MTASGTKRTFEKTPTSAMPFSTHAPQQLSRLFNHLPRSNRNGPLKLLKRNLNHIVSRARIQKQLMSASIVYLMLFLCQKPRSWHDQCACSRGQSDTCPAPDRIPDRTSSLATVHIGKPHRDSNCVAERTWSRPPVSLLNSGSNWAFSDKIARSLQM